jgi:1-acyl-sn-glycerol-3-phosphate acyltransferase
MLAIEAGLPIVPVSIGDSRHVMTKGRLMTCPGRVRLTIHPPLSTAGLGVADAKALADRARAIVADTAR